MLNIWLTFDKYECLLLLPMVVVEEHEREQAEQLICEKLKSIALFKDNEQYIAECITNGIIIDGTFEKTEGVGLTCTQNHSVRNVEKYTRY